MSYSYQTERAQIFTPEGVEMLLKIKTQVDYLLKEAGAFTAERAYSGCTGSNWAMLACLDYLVELKLIREVSPMGTWAQYRVFANPTNLPREVAS